MCFCTIADDHSGLQRFVCKGFIADATRTLVHVKETSDAVAGTMKIVQPRVPESSTSKWVQQVTCRKEHSPLRPNASLYLTLHSIRALQTAPKQTELQVSDFKDVPLVPLGKTAALTAMCPFRTYVKHSCREVFRILSKERVWFWRKFKKKHVLPSHNQMGSQNALYESHL